MRVLLFARLRELAGRDAVEVDLGEGATIAELRHAVVLQVPALAAMLPRCAVAIGGEYARDDDVVRAGSDVALIPPVSGG